MLNERKYEIRSAVSRRTNMPIPEDEPVFLFRAEDLYAVAVLKAYHGMCLQAEHKEAIRQRIHDFDLWRRVNPPKEPSSVRSLKPLAKGDSIKIGDDQYICTSTYENGAVVLKRVEHGD